MKQLFSPTVNGYVWPNLFSIIIIGLTRYYVAAEFASGVIFWGEFIILPILMGIISAWFWRHLELSSVRLICWSCFNVFIAVVLSAIFLREGVICLIIVSPLLFTFISAGAFMGRFMFRNNNQTLNVSILTLLVAVFIVDASSDHFYVNEVSDQVTINAPIKKVWPYVVAYDRIKTGNKYWLFRIGMPSPVQSTVTGYHLGAGRKCIFSNGYTFDEKIVTYDENRNLTFDITNQPRDPEIMGHIGILRGQFLLKDNGNGTTTVTGNSWYRLYVFPAWYYDIWAKSITRNVHLRVMEHIKEICEAK